MMASQEEYKVELEVFEGPLDLLLYLIKKEEVDIYDIPIERITTQYMEYLRLMRMLDLNIAGEFIVMAATLMMIKSRMLLPVEERPEIEEEEEEDPRWELVRQLLEYKKFKDAATNLQEREAVQGEIFAMGRTNIALENEDASVALEEVSIFDLIAAFKETLQRAKTDQIGEISGDRYTVADKIDILLGMIRTRATILFSELFPAEAGRHEIVCTFLALLELIRLRHINVRQSKGFGEIAILRNEEAMEEIRGE